MEAAIYRAAIASTGLSWAKNGSQLAFGCTYGDRRTMAVAFVAGAALSLVLLQQKFIDNTWGKTLARDALTLTNLQKTTRIRGNLAKLIAYRGIVDGVVIIGGQYLLHHLAPDKSRHPIGAFSGFTAGFVLAQQFAWYFQLWRPSTSN